jgi:hypothetical protein
VFVYSRFIENPLVCSWATNPSFLRWFCHKVSVAGELNDWAA